MQVLMMSVIAREQEERFPTVVWLKFSFLLVAFILLFLPKIGFAQASGWAPVQSIPGYERDNLPPYMVADQNNTVHAFTTNNFGSRLEPDRVIVYSSWRFDEGWSYPTDILISPIRNQARIQGVFLDGDGYIHVLFMGGDDKGAEMFHSRAPAIHAGNSQAWTSPKSIGENAITPDYAVLTGDKEGVLVAVYSGDIERIGLYEVHSTDGGVTWSEPESIFLTFSNKWQTSDLNIHMGKSGRVHMVWNVTDERGENVSGYYTNADIGLWSWQEPMEIDENRGLGIAIPNVVEHQNAVWIIYNNGFEEEVAPVQWTKVSYDGGLNWSNPVRPFAEHIGRNGNIAFALDSREQLHLMFAQRYFKEGERRATHGMWYSTRINENWTSLSPVVEGYSELDEAAEVGFDPYDARAVVSQGNILLLTWRTDPGLSRDGIWYTYRRLDSPALPVVPLPVPVPTALPTPDPSLISVESVATAGAAATSTTISTTVGISETGADGSANGSAGSGSADADPTETTTSLANFPAPESTEVSPAAALVFGLVPALLFIGLVVGIVRFFQRRRSF